MEGYFRLAQQFHTQADPAFCGLGSLVCALNALRIEPTGLPAVVDLVEDLGDTAVLDLTLGGVTVRARIGDGPVPKEGEAVFVTARPEDLHLFDAETRKRL